MTCPEWVIVCSLVQDASMCFWSLKNKLHFPWILSLLLCVVAEGEQWEEEKGEEEEESGEFGKECVEFISCSAALRDGRVMAESEHTVVWNMKEKELWLLDYSLCSPIRGGKEGVHHGRAPAEEDVLQAERQRQIPQEDGSQTERWGNCYTHYHTSCQLWVHSL